VSVQTTGATGAVKRALERHANGGAHIKATKCGGPVGPWVITYGLTPAQADGTITFTLPKSLTARYKAQGLVAGGRVKSSSSGTAGYKASPDGKSGTLTFSNGGSVPVAVGSFCKNGNTPGG